MIVDFQDNTTRDIFDGINSKAARKFPNSIWAAAQRKLDIINAAQELRDLASPPGNRLETLRGNLQGYFSMRINDQYRIIFKFIDGNAANVAITDYH